MRWEVISKNILVKLVCKLWNIKLRFEKFDGTLSKECSWYFLEKPDAVAIILFDIKKMSLVLVKQFRLASEFFKDDQAIHWPLELVAGSLNKDESHIAAAKRECFEEIGLDLTNFEFALKVYPSPAIFGECVHIFYSEIDSTKINFNPGGLNSECEDILPILIELDQAKKMIEDGKICDAKTMLGIYWLIQKLVEHKNLTTQVVNF